MVSAYINNQYSSLIPPSSLITLTLLVAQANSQFGLGPQGQAGGGGGDKRQNSSIRPNQHKECENVLSVSYTSSAVWLMLILSPSSMKRRAPACIGSD